MSVTVTVKGVEKVMKNLNKQVMRIKKGSLTGLIEASIVIRRDMEASAPTIPIDTGNLRASWFTVTSTGQTSNKGGSFSGDNAREMETQHSSVMAEAKANVSGNNPAVSMGFTANYAAAVHENTGANFNRPGSGAKFLESALMRNKKTILKTIAGKAKL